jgi:glycosyltransferase involved in cell wall biosynthesis
MRISLVGPVFPYRGGISHYTASLARALQTAGHALQVVSFRRQYPAWLYPGQTDKDPSTHPIKTEAEYILDPLLPWTWAQAARCMNAFQPDLVVIQWWTTFWGLPFAVLARLINRRGTPVVWMVHNVLPHEQRPWDMALARLALSAGRAFIVQTQCERERLLNLLPAAKVSLCPHPAYEILSQAALPKLEARRRLGLDPDKFWLLFFGFVRPYKGLQTLLQALGDLRREGVQPGLAIVGEFWQDKSAYLAEIDRLQIGDQVRIEDRYTPDEDVALWFSAADCLAAPYLAGTQSGVAAIALAYGLPVIASQKVAEGIAPDDRGVVLAVVPPGASGALAAAIRQAIQQPPEQPTARRGDGWRQMVQTLEGSILS